MNGLITGRSADTDTGAPSAVLNESQPIHGDVPNSEAESCPDDDMNSDSNSSSVGSYDLENIEDADCSLFEERQSKRLKFCDRPYDDSDCGYTDDPEYRSTSSSSSSSSAASPLSSDNEARGCVSDSDTDEYDTTITPTATVAATTATADVNGQATNITG